VADPPISMLAPPRIGSDCCWFCEIPGSVAPNDRGRVPELCGDPSCSAGWAELHTWPSPATHAVVADRWVAIDVPPVPPPAPEPELATFPPRAPAAKPGSWLPWRKR
jgi:hypothetical protein